jgi:hypothetical protein
MNYTKQLKNCISGYDRNSEIFREWLWNSDSKIIKNIKDSIYFKKNYFNDIISNKISEHEEDVLEQILDIIKIEPNADYFWFNYTGELTYIIPSNELRMVPGDSLRVNKEKIKSLLRDIKLNELGI